MEETPGQAEAAPTGEGPAGRPVVVGVDFSDYGRRAFAAALALANDLDVPMVLVHAFAAHFIPAEVAPDTAERLEAVEAATDRQEALALTTEWAQRARAAGRDVTTVAEMGDPAVMILAAAKDHDALMVVVGTHGRSGLRRALLGSVSERVVRHSTCPVLTVPSPDNS